METLTHEQRNNYRRELISHGIITRGLTDGELANKAMELASKAPTPTPAPSTPAPSTPAPSTPAPTPAPSTTKVPNMDDQQRADLIAQLLTPQNTPVDEAQLIRLIKEHATSTLEITAPNSKEPITIKGAHDKLPELVTWLSTGTHVYLVGPAGSGKTTLAYQAAEALARPFYSSGAVLAPYELLGTRTAHGEYTRTALREAYEHGGVFLLDEIDGCSARALIAINQLLSNDVYTFPDGNVSKHADFVVVAGANTIGTGATRRYIARNPLDGATLDRFIQLEINYDEQLELRLTCQAYAQQGGKDEAAVTAWVELVRKVRAQVLAKDLTALITPRATVNGAKGLAKGLPLKTVIEQVLAKHLTQDQRAQIEGV